MSTTPGMTSGHSFDKRGGVEIAYGVAQRKLDTDSELDRDLVLDDVPIHMAPEPATSLLIPLHSSRVPSIYCCFPCLLRRRVLSTQSFRVIEKKAATTATLRMYQTTCVRRHCYRGGAHPRTTTTAYVSSSPKTM
jgi:hypothetical protein